MLVCLYIELSLCNDSYHSEIEELVNMMTDYENFMDKVQISYSQPLIIFEGAEDFVNESNLAIDLFFFRDLYSSP